MDPAMSGGNDQTKVVQDNARLEQPSDAVPMEFLPPAGTAASQVPASTAVDSSTGDKQHIAVESTSTPNISSARADSSNQNSVGDEVSPAAVSKGKGKQEATPLPTTKERSDSILAIGPAQDDIMAAPGHSEGPVCNITLLLTSGSRHPYKIDAKYLTRRNVAIPEKDSQGQPDPFSISIYTLKELILREWRSDWETKPASPSSIRLIHFGKLLDDKEQLEKYQFSTESPNVVHMSIRPQDLDEEEPKSGSKNLPAGSGDGHRSRSGGMCCVIL